jgi:hypothetical protein
MFWGNNPNITVRNNIFYNPAGYALTRYAATMTGCTIDHNLVYGGSGMISDATGCAQSANQAGPNPQFVNASSAPYDFHVQSGAPGIDAGVNQSTVSADFDGTPRPQGSSTDVGAYEYAATAPPPTSTAPVVSGVFVSSITSNSAIVNWSTDQPATSYVQYGTSAYTNTTPTDSTPVTLHSVTLYGLSSSTPYHFAVGSRNATGQLSLSPDSTFSTAPSVAPSAVAPAAVFVKTDTAAQGSWKGVYGANGYNVIDDTISYPGYVTVTPASQSNYVWAGSTSDMRGLQKAVSATDRIAATWYSSGSFTVDLNFNDGNQHQLAVYCVDWDSGGGRAQTVSILDGMTNAVLDTQSLSSFQNGKYLVWKLTGHVILRVTNTGGINAVISGLLFD